MDALFHIALSHAVNRGPREISLACEIIQLRLQGPLSLVVRRKC